MEEVSRRFGEDELQEERMAEQQRNPFRGFLDMASEMNRMRYVGAYGQEGGGEDRERTHPTPGSRPPTCSRVERTS